MSSSSGELLYDRYIGSNCGSNLTEIVGLKECIVGHIAVQISKDNQLNVHTAIIHRPNSILLSIPIANAPAPIAAISNCRCETCHDRALMPETCS